MHLYHTNKPLILTGKLFHAFFKKYKKPMLNTPKFRKITYRSLTFDFE